MGLSKPRQFKVQLIANKAHVKMDSFQVTLTIHLTINIDFAWTIEDAKLTWKMRFFALEPIKLTKEQSFAQFFRPNLENAETVGCPNSVTSFSCRTLSHRGSSLSHQESWGEKIKAIMVNWIA